MQDFLIQELRFTTEDLDAIIEGTQKSYDRFITEKLEVGSVDRRVNDLERFFLPSTVGRSRQSRNFGTKAQRRWGVAPGRLSSKKY